MAKIAQLCRRVPVWLRAESGTLALRIDGAEQGSAASMNMGYIELA